MTQQKSLLIDLAAANTFERLKTMLDTERIDTENGMEALDLINTLITALHSKDLRKFEETWIALFLLPIIHENTNFMELMLASNIKIIPNHSLYQPLLKLIDRGNLEAFINFCHVIKKFPKDIGSITDEDGINLLHYSLRAGKSEIAKFLIKNQINIESKDIYQRNAMTFALYGSDFSCLQLCLKEQAYEQDYFGSRPLDIAAYRYSRGLVSELEFIVSDRGVILELTQNDIQRPTPIYQMKLIDKLKKYLEVTERQDSALYAELFTTDGLCHGFSFNAALDFVRNPKKTSIKEKSDFFRTLKRLSDWDEEKSSLFIKPSDSDVFTQGELIEQLLNDVIFFQDQRLSIVQHSKSDRGNRLSVIRGPESEETITKLADITLENMQEIEFNEILSRVLKPNTILDISNSFHNINISMNDIGMIQFYDPNMLYEIKLFSMDELNNLTKFIYDFLSRNHTIPESDGWNCAGYIPRYLGIYRYENPRLQLTQIESDISTTFLVERFIIHDTTRSASIDEAIMNCIKHDSECTLAELINRYKPDINALLLCLEGSFTNNSLNCAKVIFESPYLTQEELEKLAKQVDFSKYPDLYHTWQSVSAKNLDIKKPHLS